MSSQSANTKDSGNKGNNRPWQFSVLALLSKIVTNTAGGGGGGTGCCPAVVRTPTMQRVVNASSITAGKRSVSIANVGNQSGTVLGVTLKKGEVVSFDAGSNQDTLLAIAYSAVGTEFLITTIS